MITHKLIIKGQVTGYLEEKNAQGIFSLLMQNEAKIKLFNSKEFTYSEFYKNDVQLKKVDDFEKIIENCGINERQKFEVYKKIKDREEKGLFTDENVIKEIINFLILVKYD